MENMWQDPTLKKVEQEDTERSLYLKESLEGSG
jgi:hypothetical protein